MFAAADKPLSDAPADLPSRNRDTAMTDGVAEGARALLRCLTEDAGRVAVVSSFGADSAVLLALVAEIDPAVPVLFLDTGKHFAETLAYRQELAGLLGLRDVRDVRPDQAALAAGDPFGVLHATDADACCALRKVAPLRDALAPFAVWVTGRRRSQAATRAAMPVVEQDGNLRKINPLAYWDDVRIAAEFARRRLPRPPLFDAGFTSIGCAPCTRPSLPGGDARSGRWSALAKTECGIHGPSQERAA
jgi:phosphoadenosine phosphosulfate reductase